MALIFTTFVADHDDVVAVDGVFALVDDGDDMMMMEVLLLKSALI